MPGWTFRKLKARRKFFELRSRRNDVIKRWINFHDITHILPFRIFQGVCFIKIQCCRANPDVIFWEISYWSIDAEYGDLYFLSWCYTLRNHNAIACIPSFGYCTTGFTIQFVQNTVNEYLTVIIEHNLKYDSCP